MNIQQVADFLETLAPSSLQEDYDNCGLLTGNALQQCTGIICALDVTPEVVAEAAAKRCNLVVSHHPVLFGSIRRLTGKNSTEETILSAIRKDIALYAIHTSLDNVLYGVNGKIASRLGLQHTAVLQHKEKTLKKIYSFVPADYALQVRHALFAAGGGQIGQYSECSFNSEGTGTFKAGEGSNPFVGEKGSQHEEKEIRVEMVFPAAAEQAILSALRASHPYEEVAYDVVSLDNTHPAIGSGLVGKLPFAMGEKEFLAFLSEVFEVPAIRHTAFRNRNIQKLALCGGSGSFLISKALASGADAYVTADIRYHQFFDAQNQMLLCDVGHYESEQFTIGLLQEVLEQKFPNFAVLKTEVRTNPVHYFLK